MPPKTVTCCICGEETSKRKSIEVKKGERACRSHEEAVERLKILHNEFIEQVHTNRMNSFMRVTSAVAFIRAMHTIHGVPLALLFGRVRASLKPDEMKEVRKEVEKRGAEMSTGEVVGGLLAYSSLQEKPK